MQTFNNAMGSWDWLKAERSWIPEVTVVFQKLVALKPKIDRKINLKRIRWLLVPPSLPIQTTQQQMACKTPKSEAPPSDDLNDEEDKNLKDIKTLNLIMRVIAT